MTQTVVTIQIAPESRPSTPPWMGEVAVVAQVLSHMGVLKAIQEQVRFARARFGQYDLIDFVVVLIGYARSFEPTLKAFCERLLPFAEPFMALFGRHLLPHRSTLSRFLAALDQASVETLRTLFQEDLVARNPFASPGGMFDRTGKPWLVVDVDGTRQAARQRTAQSFVSACSPPSFRSGLRAGLTRPEAWRGRAHAHQHPTGTYPSVFGHFWRARQWGLPRRTPASYPGKHQLCHKACASYCFCAASSRWSLWRRRSAHRCPDRWPRSDCQKS